MIAMPSGDGLHCVYGKCQGVPYSSRPCHPGCRFQMSTSSGIGTGWVLVPGESVEAAPRPLSAKAKRMVLKAMSSHRINLQMARHTTTVEDKISELDMDITFVSAVIRMIEEWGVKVP